MEAAHRRRAANIVKLHNVVMKVVVNFLQAFCCNASLPNGLAVICKQYAKDVTEYISRFDWLVSVAFDTPKYEPHLLAKLTT